MHQLGRKVIVRGKGSIVHNVGKKQKGKVIILNAFNFTANHYHPFIENLFQVIGRNLGTDNITMCNCIFLW